VWAVVAFARLGGEGKVARKEGEEDGERRGLEEKAGEARKWFKESRLWTASTNLTRTHSTCILRVELTVG
jgi:hypothetical protein